MKRPLIDYNSRLVARKVPDSIVAWQVESTIATARLKREIGKEIKPVMDWIIKRIMKWKITD